MIPFPVPLPPSAFPVFRRLQPGLVPEEQAAALAAAVGRAVAPQPVEKHRVVHASACRAPRRRSSPPADRRGSSGRRSGPFPA